jgi:uncharacterized LabA/DUF88 family protein
MMKRTERMTLRPGRLEGGPGKVYEKGVDILVALELLRGAYKDEYDAAILVAGDGDYADVALAVKDAGKTLVNSFLGDLKSYELSQAVSGFVDLANIQWNRIELRPDHRRWS